MSRYTRDELIDRALNLINSSPLSNHDRPGGVISPNAYCIQWLQDCLDKYHTQYPFSGDLTEVGVTMTANQRHLTVTSGGAVLPSDFSVDVRNGIYLLSGSTYRRLIRKSFQDWLPIWMRSQNQAQQFPEYYCKFQGKINLAPLFNTTYTGNMWYFSKPGVLSAGTIPQFPEETCLIEFIRIKGLEWTKQYPPGTAEAYFQKAMGRLKTAGLLDEPEFDAFPIEQTMVGDYQIPRAFTWMGPV